MKRKILIIISALLIVLAFIFEIYKPYSVYTKLTDYYYSVRLVSAIREENITEVQQIIDKRPTCINTRPALTSDWWHAAMGWRSAYYPLNEACSTGNVEIIELLIENGADVSCNDGTTPLSTVYKRKWPGWYDVSLYLIEHGASLDYVTYYSGTKSSVFLDIFTAFSLQSETEQEEIIKTYYYAIENCDLSNVNWIIVIEDMIYYHEIEAVKFLLDQGRFDVNETYYGRTALMFAARDSTLEMVQLLLDYGADKSIKDDDGMTAYDYAVKKEKHDIANLLKP